MHCEPGRPRGARARARVFHEVLRSFLTRCGDSRGSAAIIFAVGSIGFVAMLGVSMDYARAISMKARLQAALDNSMVSAASDRTGADRAALATRLFNAAFTPKDGVASASFSYDPNNAVLTGSASASLPTTIGAAILPAITVTARGAASSAASQVTTLDLVLCIEATSSSSYVTQAFAQASSNFAGQLDAALAAKGAIPYDQLRVKVIYMRSYGNWLSNWALDAANIVSIGGTPPDPMHFADKTGDTPALEAYGFYTLPAQSGQLYAAANTPGLAHSKAGNPIPLVVSVSGQECVDSGVNSAWTKVGDTLPSGKKVDVAYQVIVVYSAQPAEPTSFSWALMNPAYPASMPRSDSALLAEWKDGSRISQTGQRLLLDVSFTKTFLSAKYVASDYIDYTVTNQWTKLLAWPNATQMPAMTASTIFSELATYLPKAYGSGLLTR